MAVLRATRQIQAKHVTQLCELPWRCALAGHLLNGITGYDMNYQKDEGQNELERRQGKGKSFEKVERHLRRLT